MNPSQPRAGWSLRASILSAASVAALFAAGAAQAQAPTAGEVDEIVVTATKRAENLQDVPLSVGVITGESAERQGLDRAIDAALKVPGVNFQMSNEQRTASISIRGIGSNGVAEGFEPSVVTIVDGEVYARASSLVENIMDVERVEVLRGPQGTLFGKNTSSGAVQVVTKRPVLGELSGYVIGRLAQDEERTAKASANIPLSDNIAARLAVSAQHVGGWLPNVAPGGEPLTRSNAWSGRAQLLWAPRSDFDIVFRADYSRQSNNGGAAIAAAIDNAALRSLVTALGQPVGPEVWAGGLDTAQFSHTLNRGLGVEATKTFGDFELKYLGFTRNYDLDENADQDAILINGGPQRTGGYVDTTTMQHELRLTSPATERLNYIVGLFYYRSDVEREASTNFCTALATATLDTGGVHATNRTYVDPVTLKVTDCQGAGTSPYNTVQSLDTGVKNENAAVFGEVNFDVTERLRLFAGARYLWEKSSLRFRSDRVTTEFRGSDKDQALIGRAGAQYHFTDDINVFGSWSRGYKGVSWNNTIGALASDFVPGGEGRLDPEHSEQFELGLRSQFLDRALTFNVTAFELTIEDFQEQVQRFIYEDPANPSLPTGTQGATVNAGEVRSRGVEVDVRWRTPLDGLTLTFGGNRQKAVYEDFGGNFLPCPTAFLGSTRCFVFDPPGPAAPAEFTDPTGYTLPRAPKWQFVLGADYERELGASGYELLLNVSYNWQDDYNFDTNQDPARVQSSYGVLDASASLRSPDGRYTFTVFGRNLTDEFFYSSLNNRTANIGGGIRAGVPRGAHRYFGASLRADF